MQLFFSKEFLRVRQELDSNVYKKLTELKFKDVKTLKGQKYE